MTRRKTKQPQLELLISLPWWIGAAGALMIDGNALNRMIAGVRKRPTRDAEQSVKPLHRVEPTFSASPSCPKCGREMTRRVAKKGPKAREPFWGCSGFPKCRGIVAGNP